jgi:hypothetical protein
MLLARPGHKRFFASAICGNSLALALESDDPGLNPHPPGQFHVGHGSQPGDLFPGPNATSRWNPQPVTAMENGQNGPACLFRNFFVLPRLSDSKQGSEKCQKVSNVGSAFRFILFIWRLFGRCPDAETLKS